MTNILTFPVRISAIMEHHRTIRGGKDSLGQVYTETINLGYFLHLEMADGEPFGVAIGVGQERPPNLEVGETLLIRLSKPQ